MNEAKKTTVKRARRTAAQRARRAEYAAGKTRQVVDATFDTLAKAIAALTARVAKAEALVEEFATMLPEDTGK